ncbi:fibrinogen-like protein A isoform X2 [Haliotis rubra]|uniref:fibrinogen-like protein A isoform X2 n=1 Tax=Haliotis rubra TaxID=36100 RepID=UPI001EE59262|nr:fibrinogen-like protein A isoform X2 [Haliotis rubra]
MSGSKVTLLQVTLSVVFHLGTLLHGSYGLRCLECQEVYKPDDCALSGACGQDELCFTRSFINNKGRQAYRLGCESTDVCDLFARAVIVIGKRSPGRDQTCRQCCSHDNCNEKLCVSSTPTTHTPSTMPPMTTSSSTAETVTVTTPAPTTSLITVTSSTSARDCLSLLEQGITSSGVYSVSPDGGTPFNVYCDMTGDGGGWTLVQRRVNETVGFDKNWAEYKNGFGSLDGNFWLGTDLLHRFTVQAGRNYTLRFELTVTNGSAYHAFYNSFSVAGEADKYRVSFMGYSGNAGDSFGNHNGLQFSTYDSDNDKSLRNCAQMYKGGWWYHKCYDVNINGLYGNQGDRGMVWYAITGWYNTVTATTMSIRPQL